MRTASRGDQDRTGAEEFALQFANFYTDVRPRLDDEQILEDFTSDEFPSIAATFILDEHREHRKFETGRRYDDTVPMWIRSKADDGPESGFAVEVAGNGVAPGLSFRTWLKVRVDVAVVDGHWVAADFSTAVARPSQTKNLTDAESRELLAGRGWREITP